ncbi:M23 family metallopeptidase [Streptomyces sp. NPDC058045]|uniref:M23 family metallopeptidase n=1 Tax=Streptomyces sp. NPDC058045 TaxID=3346311 RepID=UPI0036E2127C
MPAKGRHRRTRTTFLSRSLTVAGTGGAALALPLLGAPAAHAAPGQSAKPAQAPAQTRAATGTASAATYTVQAGDCLARIAKAQQVDGGWRQLYRDNRGAIGSDPSLIHPGLRLTLGKPGAAKAAPETAAETAPRSAAPKAAAPKPAAASASAGGYALPVAGATVGTPYHQAGGMWSSGYHTGTDFVVPTGTGVRAVAAGTVVSAGWGGAYGNQVVVRHDDGRYSQYAHLSQLAVAAGQQVSGGTPIGLSGATGNVTGPHLHFEIRTGPDYGSDVDPVAYLRSHGLTI